MGETRGYHPDLEITTTQISDLVMSVINNNNNGLLNTHIGT